MGFFKRRSRADPITVFYAGEGCAPAGYHRLLDAPEVAACVDRICAIVASAPIHQMESGKKGDKRIRDELSRFIDVTPWAPMGTRAAWMSWIVATMLTVGDGEAYLLPHYVNVNGRVLIDGLEPMPGAMAVPDEETVYKVHWRGAVFAPDEIVPFRLFADLDQPWRGRGYRVQASKIAASLKQTGELKDSLSSPQYKPPMLIAVNSDVDFSTPGARDEFIENYLEHSESGKPWVFTADLLNVSQMKPLTLADLAVKDTVELDKRTVAAIFGVPPFLLGLGGYNEAEYNGFIRTVIVHICKVIEQTLTSSLLISPNRYFRFNRRHLYAYDLKTLIDM
ncbi:MAG: phage portal protein, partial [Muribaculaceae bacterium]|nr:phage portal protein [Muribaculaceae bacterium]